MSSRHVTRAQVGWTRDVCVARLESPAPCRDVDGHYTDGWRRCMGAITRMKTPAVAVSAVAHAVLARPGPGAASNEA